MGEQPFGRKRSDRTGAWVELGSRYERFESQPPVDAGGQRASLSFGARSALKIVQGEIDKLSNYQTHANNGRRIGMSLPNADQRRHEKWWRGRVAQILSNQAAEAPAQVIYLTPPGERRAA